MERLARLTALERLGLNFTTGVTGTGLEHLSELENLNELWLFEAWVTDEGLSHIKGLRHLTKLYLGDTKLTDAGLKHIEGLTQLEELDVGYTRVTDAGLEHLRIWATSANCSSKLPRTKIGHQVLRLPTPA